MVAKTDGMTKKEEAEKKRATRLQVVGLLLLLMTLMSVSVVTALMATGVIDVTYTPSGPANSMTDAQIICDKRIAEEYGNNLQTFALDNLSSHEVEESGGFKLYYEMSKYRDASRTTGTINFYLNCFVSATGRIKLLEIYEEGHYGSKPSRKGMGGNRIGL